MEKEHSIIKVAGLPIVVAGFNWSVGALMEKYIKALADKKLLATKCPNCGYIYTPPRTRCGKCHTKMGDADIVELSGKGTLIGCTVASVNLDGKGKFVDLEKPKIIGAIKLDGADSTIFMQIEGIETKNMQTGIKVQIEWSAETKGAISDIKCFKPI